MSGPERKGVLFVCLGNICRSPVARVVFDHMIKSHGIAEQYDVDSCGTGGWHVGGPADPRSVLVAANYGLNLAHTARRFDVGADCDRFHFLIGMDRANVATMLEVGAPREKVKLLRSFDPDLATRPEDELEVPDPYYGGPDGFEKMYSMISRACEGLVAATRR